MREKLAFSSKKERIFVTILLVLAGVGLITSAVIEFYLDTNGIGLLCVFGFVILLGVFGTIAYFVYNNPECYITYDDLGIYIFGYDTKKSSHHDEIGIYYKDITDIKYKKSKKFYDLKCGKLTITTLENEYYFSSVANVKEVYQKLEELTNEKDSMIQ